jgi:hypothetical protein
VTAADPHKPMDWYYAEGGAPRGPVGEAEFERLVQAGRIRSETLVWCAGMADWQAYGTVRMAADPAAAVAPGEGAVGVVCSQCGKAFPPDEVIRYSGALICAGCKPVYLQRLREGITARPAAPAGHRVGEEELLTRGYLVNVGGALDRAWQAYSTHTGPMIGATALLGAGFVVGWVMTVLIGLVLPLVNGLLLAMVNGILMGGMVRLCLAALRGERVEVGMVFSGFGPQAPQLMLCSLVQAVIGLLLYLPVVGVMFSVGLFASGHRDAGSLQALGAGMVLVFVLLGLLTFAAMILLSTIWVFSIALIVDKGYHFWPAMRLSARRVRGRLGMTLLFLAFTWVLYCAGAMLCLVGLLITVPLFVTMKAVLYEENFRDLMPPG